MRIERINSIGQNDSLEEAVVTKKSGCFTVFGNVFAGEEPSEYVFIYEYADGKGYCLTSLIGKEFKKEDIQRLNPPIYYAKKKEFVKNEGYRLRSLMGEQIKN